jgi:hypothetical protein
MRACFQVRDSDTLDERRILFIIIILVWMDKENKEDFSFGRSCDLKVPVTFRMSVMAFQNVRFPLC